MSSAFAAIDLARLPAPQVIETPDHATIYAEMMASFLALMPDFSVPDDTDPVAIVLQVAAYREMVLRARINDAAKAVMVAYAIGADLDQLGAIMGVSRFLITPADPDHNIAAVYENDDDFRRRLVLAPEGYSVAGPEGAYIYHALSADADVLDASATSPSPGSVLVTVLSRTGNGAASPGLVGAVQEYLSAETRRPLTDFVTVQSAEIINYSIIAAITTFDGPDPAIALADAQARLAAYVSRSHRLGLDVARSGLFAALHTEGVQHVVITSPSADVVIGSSQASWCLSTAVTHAGVGS